MAVKENIVNALSLLSGLESEMKKKGLYNGKFEESMRGIIKYLNDAKDEVN